MRSPFRSRKRQSRRGQQPAALAKADVGNIIMERQFFEAEELPGAWIEGSIQVYLTEA